MKLSTLVLVLATGLGLASCSPRSPQAAEMSSSLNVLTWEDYFPEEVLDAFEERTGATLNIIEYSNSDEGRSLLMSQPEDYDVIITDDLTLRLLVNQQLLAKLDKKQLPHFGNLGDYAGQSYDPNNDHSIPYLWGTTLLSYNSELVTREPRSWTDLWDPELTKGGLVGMLNEPTELFAAALLSLGHSPNEVTEEQVIEARDFLLQKFDELNMHFLGEVEMIDALRDNYCAAALAYSGDALMAAEDNENIVAIIPEEGAVLWVDNLSISRECKAKKLAHRFLDFTMEAEIAKQCAEYNWYASPNVAAEEILDPELLEDTTIYPPTPVLERCFYFDNSAKYRRLISVHMRPIKERAKTDQKFATAE